MNGFAWFVTILGLVATLVGSLLAVVTYISPLTRLRFYLRRPKNWKKVYIGRLDYNWQYNNHPEFAITQDDESREWTIEESWMTNYPDPGKSSTLVKVTVNGMVLLTEDFISLDGGRYFVPVPKRKAINELGDTPEFEYWYTPQQVHLARIVGYYYRINSIEEFISAHHLVVKIEKE